MDQFIDNLEQTMDYSAYYVWEYLTYAIVAVFAVVLVLYLLAEDKNRNGENFKKATALKLALSGMFCAVGVISLFRLIYFPLSIYSDVMVAYAVILVASLFAALGGDYFLQYIRLDNKKYRIGIGFFSVTQILLIVYLCLMNLIGWMEFVIMAGILLLVLTLMKKQNWKLGPEQKIVTVYTLLIAFMTAKAITGIFHEKTLGALVLAIGAALFMASDILLGVWNYHTNKRVHANLNWITYFSGMMLIAISISPNMMAVTLWV